ncbi:hypothetical protein NDI56_02775 [Haloarcula sp. S1CR25-12]|uniref:Uncharacterized protein n=1 Tax=Haloarcula saliterrae TaxID=2950534 RepID=A0ABU2F945_9EURY|nr:DUF6653 family protein [Haloarcula sp. S1CR25-12]MDS0258331.1 hypothetical protein [Haloarcula sp. S1CR25-12]
MVPDRPDDASPLDRYFWARHANPKSGWSRVATMPLLMACIYRRNWRGLALTLAFVLLNPVLFSPPEDDSAWMTRVVYGERLWTRESHGWLSYPEILNVGNGLAVAYALYAAVRQRPAETALATALSMTLKLWFVSEMVHRYENRAE